MTIGFLGSGYLNVKSKQSETQAMLNQVIEDNHFKDIKIRVTQEYLDAYKEMDDEISWYLTLKEGNKFKHKSRDEVKLEYPYKE